MQYSNPGIAMLTYAVTASLRNGPHKDIRTLLRERVMRPIGVPEEEWSIGYGQTFVVDGLPLVASWGGGSYTARAVARVGRLMLREGDWEGRQLINSDAVRQVTRDVGRPGNCGIGWWSNNEGECAKLPRDAFWGSGAGHQIVLVVPSLNLIAVRNGELLAAAASEPSQYHEPVRRFLFEPLVDAVIGNPQAQPVSHRAAWMQEARWGVMTHYLADWKAHEAKEEMTIEKWNEMIDHFDVEGLAEQLKSVGAGYYLVTIGQNSGYYLSPNATYDRLVGIQPSKCSRRDLVADLYMAMHKRGIKLMVYLPAGAPGGDSIARGALQWQNGPNRNREFQLKWEQVVKWSQGIRKQGGVITWDVPIQPTGLIARPFIDQLTAVGKALGPR
jgi:hypothetical protein